MESQESNFSGGALPPSLLGDVVAGFPSPAESYTEEPLDLNRLLVYRPAATFYVRASGESMIGAGIHDGDILVVDKSIQPRDGQIVIACLDGDFTVKYLRVFPNGAQSLEPANPRFSTIAVTNGMNCEIFGVVTAVIHQFVKERVRN